MCGLVGVAGQIWQKEESMFKTLLKLDTMRGMHSTGVFAISYNLTTKAETQKVVKSAKDGFQFLDDKASNALFLGQTQLLMGHNRHATRGAINDVNAHPFEFERIVGAHNGSLTSYYNMHDSQKYEVDSQALYSELNANGVDSMWGKLEGAASLTWYDRETGQLNFIRNSQRPMVIVKANKGRTIFWASEVWMLIVAAAKHGVEFDDKPLEPTINHLYTVTFPRGYQDPITTIEERAVKPFVAPVYDYQRETNRWESPNKSAPKGSSGKFLEKEAAKVGDKVYFAVNRLHDYRDAYSDKPRCNVIGYTEFNTPIRIFSVDSFAYADILDAMWDGDGLVFTGIIVGECFDGLLLSIGSVISQNYTMADLIEGGNPDTIVQETEVKKPYLSYQAKPCSKCRAYKRELYEVKGKDVCTRCYDLTQKAV